MADLDVVWKRRSNVIWLWILIALIVVALWFAFSGGSSRSTSTGQLGVPPAPIATGRSVAQT